MALVIPALIAPMPQGIVPQPSRLLDRPTEGNKRISASLNWPVGGANAVRFNCQTFQGPNQFSTVKAVYVDNLNSDADVFFIDPSAVFQLQVPARSEGLFPVEMNAAEFIVSAPLAATGDSVNFQAYNFLPPPMNVIPPFLTSSVILSGTAVGSGTTALIPAGTSGIITGITITASNLLGGAGIGTDSVLIQDGSTPVVTEAAALFSQGNAAYTGFQILLSLTAINLRFRNGLNMLQAVTGTAFASGAITTNIQFR